MSVPPEIKLARRLIAVKRLKPPVNVLDLARSYAKVTLKNIPFEIDGVCLNLKHPKKRPHVFVNTARSEGRIRFTLAHELGHILIPWHIGSIIDETETDDAEDASEYWRIEAEANRFASELLMPTVWVEDLVKSGGEPLDLVDKIRQEAEVSAHAATLKLIGCLPAGYIFAQTEKGIVVSSGRSPHTLAGQPATGERIKATSQFPFAERRDAVLSGAMYHWWNFNIQVKCPPRSGNREWRDLMDDIVQDMDLEGENARKFKSSVNGMIAYANGQTRNERSRDAIYNACLQRLFSHGDQAIKDFVGHPKFDQFIAAKIDSLLRS